MFRMDEQTRKLKAIFESMETMEPEVVQSEPEAPSKDPDDVKWSLEELDEPMKTRAVTVLHNASNGNLSKLVKTIAESTNFYYNVVEQLMLTVEQGLTRSTEGGYQNMLDELKDPDPQGLGILLTDFELTDSGEGISFKNIWVPFTFTIPKALFSEEGMDGLPIVVDILLKVIAHIYMQFPTGEASKVNFTVAIKKYVANKLAGDLEEMSNANKKALGILNTMFGKSIELESILPSCL